MNFTLPRLFRNPAISNFFPFPLGLRNSGVRLVGCDIFSLHYVRLCDTVYSQWIDNGSELIRTERTYLKEEHAVTAL